jgi:hypothetical protein
VAALVLLGQRDRLVELLFLNRPGEVRRELPGGRALLWICQSLFSAMVSEKKDMISSTITIPFAKGPA